MSGFASIADLDIPVTDDLNVPVDPTDYADQAAPMPPLPGIYRFVATKAEWAKKKDGGYVLQDQKFPIFKLIAAKIVEPTENERGVGLLQDIRTKFGTRKGRRGEDVAYSDFNDFLRSYDAREPLDFESAKQRLQQYLETNQTFLGELTWGAVDYDYVKSEQEKAGGKDKLSKELSNAIWSKARKNARDFIVNGQRVASILGPSGNMLEARPAIRRFIPSHQFDPTTGEWKETSENLGPFKK